MDHRHIEPFTRPARGTVVVPGSKSLNNRALLFAALADGRSILRGALDSDDTRIFARCLQALGVEVRHDAAARTFTVEGTGGRLNPQPADLFVGNAGTAARFLMPLAGLAGGWVRLDGVGAMRKRPMGDLMEALRAQGVEVACDGPEGYLPVRVRGKGLRGGQTTLNADKSSQQASALMMLAPYATTDSVITLAGDVVSEPYLAMTLAMMAQWGAEAVRPSPERFQVSAKRPYRARDYEIEADASSASYFFAAAAATRGRVAVKGLSLGSLQGDARFASVLETMGCRVLQEAGALVVEGPDRLRGIDVDMNDISDTAPTLAAIAPGASGPVRIRGVEHMRWKETDRIEAMATELRRLGARLETHPDGLTIYPGPLLAGTVETYEDHRIAMSMTVAGIANAGVEIKDPDCVSKTFGEFWATLEALRAQSHTEVAI